LQHSIHDPSQSSLLLCSSLKASTSYSYKSRRVHQQAATTLLSPPVLCSSKQQAASLHFDPSLCYFLFHQKLSTYSSNQSTPAAAAPILSFFRLFFHPRFRAIACNYFLHKTAASISLLPPVVASRASCSVHCLFPVPKSTGVLCSAADRLGSAPVCTCGWEFGRNSLPPLPRCCHQRAIGYACAASVKPHMP
jgi:hypothetical protein